MTTKHFTQSSAYQQSFKSSEVIKLESGNITTVGYLKQLPLGIKVLYIPHGPTLTNDNLTDFNNWLKIVKETAQKLGCALVRFDPQLNNLEPTVLSSLTKSPKSAYRSFFIQPRFEWRAKVMPLEQLLTNFNQSTRRDYNLAIRSGLTISFYSELTETIFADFYSLLAQTAKFQNFKPQSQNYVSQIVKTALVNQTGWLALVYHQNQPVAGAFIMTEDHTAFYVYGGLNYEAEITGSTVFMHSQIIDHCHNLGFKFYNFGSINHLGLFPAYSGITTFKQKFPGEVIDYGPLYDLIIKPLWYYVYTLIRWWRDSLKQLKS